jgi:hypothetical protein
MIFFGNPYSLEVFDVAGGHLAGQQMRKSRQVSHQAAAPIHPGFREKTLSKIRSDIHRDPFEGDLPGNAAFGMEIKQIGDLTITESFAGAPPGFRAEMDTSKLIAAADTAERR